MQNQLFQAIATLRGEVISADEKLSLLCEDGLLVNLTRHWRCRPPIQPMSNSGVTVGGYPRFSPRTGKLESLVVSTFHSMNSIRSPGHFDVAGLIFATMTRQLIIKVVPCREGIDPFFIPIAGNLPKAKEGEIWRIRAKLGATRSLELLSGEKTRELCPLPRPKHLPKLQPKKTRSHRKVTLTIAS